MARSLLLFLISFFLLFSCNDEKNIVDRKDLVRFLEKGQHSHLTHIDSEIIYWQKRFIDVPDDIIARTKIAGLYTKRFAYSGRIQEIHMADSLYKLVNHVNRINSSSTYRSLASNCITLHQFQQAEKYIDSALELGDDKMQTRLMEFDIAMELGKIQRAGAALASLPDKKSFEYLIRASKFEDHAKGDLDEAILLMETALVKSKEIQDTSISLWVKSNLGDLYGHANRFEESYHKYIEVLEADPEYYHALKGIAWLAFSKDRNAALAKEILNHLRDVHPVPDYDLLLAEIADFEGDTIGSAVMIESFSKRVNHYMYGSMYNKYLFNLQAETLSQPSEALRIAKMESESRPTGEVFSWLAWAYQINGQKEKALETIRYHVENKCFEPESLYLMGKIFQSNGFTEKAKLYLKMAKESSYELGPLYTKQIDQSLADL